MTDTELRALVRDAIARHLGPARPGVRESAVGHWAAHASHGRLTMAAGCDGSSPCVIEPHVTCDRCGYCQSLGH